MESFWVQNPRRVKKCKLSSRLGESSIFKVPGTLKNDQKSYFLGTLFGKDPGASLGGAFGALGSILITLGLLWEGHSGPRKCCFGTCFWDLFLGHPFGSTLVQNVIKMGVSFFHLWAFLDLPRPHVWQNSRKPRKLQFLHTFRQDFRTLETQQGHGKPMRAMDPHCAHGGLIPPLGGVPSSPLVVRCLGIQTGQRKSLRRGAAMVRRMASSITLPLNPLPDLSNMKLRP